MRLLLLLGWAATASLAFRSSMKSNPAKQTTATQMLALMNPGQDAVSVEEPARRTLLTTALLTASAVGLSQFTGLGVPTTGTTLDLDRALQRLEKDCDRRFLHAVVASDYCLMYQGFQSRQSQITIPNSDPLPVPSDAADCLAWQSSHWAVASPEQAALVMGPHVCSIWPLQSTAPQKQAGRDVHYAWLERGRSFATKADSDKFVVDGVDCGRLSLDDALEQGKEVLFQAERYLVVPRAYEQALLEKLQGAFLI